MPRKKADTAQTVETEVKKAARRGRKKASEVAETVKDTAVKAEEAVAEAVEKAAEAVTEAMDKAGEAARNIEEKAEPAMEMAKKTAVKTARKTAEAVEKAAETTRKARRKKNTEVWVQARLGGEITVDEVLARIREKAGEPDSVYIKAEENKAFYVADGKTGYVELWK